jgi:hypothetical protein
MHFSFPIFHFPFFTFCFHHILFFILFSKNPKEKPKNPKMKNGIEQKFLVDRGVTSVKRGSCKRLDRAIQEQDKTCP